MIYGYARISADGQTFDAQRAAPGAAGAKTDRRQLARVLAALNAGDVCIVTRLDRLARSTCDSLNTLDTIAKAGAGFRSLADTWADMFHRNMKML